MDSELAKDGKLILDELGLNPTSFITMAYKRLVAERKIPFDTKLTDEENARLSILMNSRQQKTINLDTAEKVKKWINDEDQ